MGKGGSGLQERNGSGIKVGFWWITGAERERIMGELWESRWVTGAG